MKKIIFRKPILATVERFEREKLVPSAAATFWNYRQAPLEDGRSGKFVICTEHTMPDAIRLFGLFAKGFDIDDSVEHADIVEILCRVLSREQKANELWRATAKRETILPPRPDKIDVDFLRLLDIDLRLGGGYVRLDAQARTLETFARSIVFGWVPNPLIEATLREGNSSTLSEYTFSINGQRTERDIPGPPILFREGKLVHSWYKEHEMLVI